MRQPLFVHMLNPSERAALVEALCAPDAFTIRRAQILLASAQARHNRNGKGCRRKNETGH